MVVNIGRKGLFFLAIVYEPLDYWEPIFLPLHGTRMEGSTEQEGSTGQGGEGKNRSREGQIRSR